MTLFDDVLMPDSKAFMTVSDGGGVFATANPSPLVVICGYSA